MSQDINIKKLLSILPGDDVIVQCMHCGMCLSTCPTYNVDFLERSSPRGRIRLIKSLAEGKLDITQTFIDEMNYCLDCQACETACPAGVKYGSLVEAARDIITKSGKDSFGARYIKRFALHYVVGSKLNIKIVGKLLYFYQNFGIEWLANKFFGLFKSLKIMVEMNKMTPRISKVFSDSQIKEITEPVGEARYNVIVPTGCIMNVAFADINLDTVEVLKRNNCRIICPPDQGCCGSLMAHYGELDLAKDLAKKTIDQFSKYKFDYIVSNSAGCAAYMKEYAHIFEDDPDYSERAKVLSGRVKEVTEFIDMAGITAPLNSVKETVTYHDACHLCHTQKITKEPRALLNQIPGLDLKPLDESMWCCGSAGIYNVVRYEDSMKFLKRKMENIKNTGADTVVTGNPGCMGQIQYGAEKFNVPVKVIHPVSLLRKSLEENQSNH